MELRCNLSLQIDAGLLVEDMADMAGEVELDVGAAGEGRDLCGSHVHGGNHHEYDRR